RLGIQLRCLVFELPRLVANEPRHNSRDASRRRFAGSATTERTGRVGSPTDYGAILGWADAGAPGSESNRRAAGAADHEAASVDAGRSAKQAGFSGGSDSAPSRERIGVREVLHIWRAHWGWTGLPGRSMM